MGGKTRFGRLGAVSPARIALIYGAVAGLWIWWSDTVVSFFLNDPVWIQRAQTAKGLAFIAVTAGLVYILALGLQRRIQAEAGEREKAERALRQMQKMEAVGQLTGGIAHDFNNILGIVLGNLELAKRQVKDSPDIEKRIDRALAGVERGTALTRKLLYFARTGGEAEETVDLGEVLREAGDLILNSLPPGIDFEMTVPEGLWSVRINSGDFIDCFINLCINARDAMGPKGQLFIEAGNKRVEASFSGDLSGDFVMVGVTDTGSGIPAEILDRVFEPMFTTKTNGTGLGLSMVYGFASRSGGEVRIYSQPGLGTSVRLFLPRHGIGGQEPELMGGAGKEELPRGNETVLVVDDEEPIRDVMAAALRELGYRVLVAGDAEEAISVCEKTAVGIDLVLSDVVMPGRLDGYGLALALQERWPRTKVLLTSGFGQIPGGGPEGVPENLSRRILSKPFNRAELATTVRALLDEGG